MRIYLILNTYLREDKDFMMSKPAIGTMDFESIIVNNMLYIDKTEFIKEWWESGDWVTLIMRPCGFGKSLNISMLEQFFSINYADKKYLFERKRY